MVVLPQDDGRGGAAQADDPRVEILGRRHGAHPLGEGSRLRAAAEGAQRDRAAGGGRGRAAGAGRRRRQDRQGEQGAQGQGPQEGRR